MTAITRPAEAVRGDHQASRGRSAQRSPGRRPQRSPEAEAAARPCDVAMVLEALRRAAAVHDAEIAEAGLLSCASAMDA
jgi:hypothetical protein